MWLRSGPDPCPWGPSTVNWAAACAHLHVLKWARANGCPWDKTKCLRCAKFGLKDEFGELDPDCDPGDMDIIQWILTQSP